MDQLRLTIRFSALQKNYFYCFRGFRTGVLANDHISGRNLNEVSSPRTPKSTIMKVEGKRITVASIFSKNSETFRVPFIILWGVYGTNAETSNYFNNKGFRDGFLHSEYSCKATSYNIPPRVTYDKSRRERISGVCKLLNAKETVFTDLKARGMENSWGYRT